MEERVVYIYALEFPKGEIRYIGKAVNIKTRYQKHLRDAKYSTNSRRLAWIRSLLNSGLKPFIEVIDEVCEGEWQFWEKYYISLYKQWGFDLVNSTFGGEGLEANEEVKRKISLSCKEYWRTHDNWCKGKKGLKIGPKSGHVFSEEVVKKRIEILNKYSSENEPWNKNKSFRKPNIFYKKSTTGLKNPAKRVIQLSLNMEFIKEWGSASEAGYHLGMGADPIRKCVKGLRENAFGFIWMSKLKFMELYEQKN